MTIWPQPTQRFYTGWWVLQSQCHWKWQSKKELCNNNNTESIYWHLAFTCLQKRLVISHYKVTFGLDTDQCTWHSWFWLLQSYSVNNKLSGNSNNNWKKESTTNRMHVKEKKRGGGGHMTQKECFEEGEKDGRIKEEYKKATRRMCTTGNT